MSTHELVDYTTFIVNREKVTYSGMVHLIIYLYKISEMNCAVEMPLLAAEQIYKTTSALDVCFQRQVRWLQYYFGFGGKNELEERS